MRWYNNYNVKQSSHEIKNIGNDNDKRGQQPSPTVSTTSTTPITKKFNKFNRWKCCINLLINIGFNKYINNKNEKRLIFDIKWLNKLKKLKNLLYNTDIINQLIQFEIGTKMEIMNAMDNVKNRNDINEIVEYITLNKDKQQYSVLLLISIFL